MTDAYAARGRFPRSTPHARHAIPSCSARARVYRGPEPHGFRSVLRSSIHLRVEAAPGLCDPSDRLFTLGLVLDGERHRRTMHLSRIHASKRGIALKHSQYLRPRQQDNVLGVPSRVHQEEIGYPKDSMSLSTMDARAALATICRRGEGAPGPQFAVAAEMAEVSIQPRCDFTDTPSLPMADDRRVTDLLFTGRNVAIASPVGKKNCLDGHSKPIHCLHNGNPCPTSGLPDLLKDHVSHASPLKA